MRLGVNSIDKDGFIQLYPIAREAAFKAQTIHNSFKGTGLEPLDATSVLDKPNIQLDSLPPSIPLELRPASSSSTSDLDTLWSLLKLQKMNSQIKKGLEPSSETMTSPLKRAIDRSHNMAVRLTHELIFIQDRCTRLETANKKQVKKRASGGKQISHEGSLRSLEEIRADLV
ncbi:Transposase [Penicillium frequentans]|nr:Transposase [Penicillium glabrum]